VLTLRADAATLRMGRDHRRRNVAPETQSLDRVDPLPVAQATQPGPEHGKVVAATLPTQHIAWTERVHELLRTQHNPAPTCDPTARGTTTPGIDPAVRRSAPTTDHA